MKGQQKRARVNWAQIVLAISSVARLFLDLF
jgi:hypothetical protein